MIKESALTPMVSLDQRSCPVNWAEVFGRQASLEVEIGFGLGEFLIRSARQFPDRNFLGLETHQERIGKALRMAGSLQASDPGALANLKILCLDARTALEWCFAPRSVSMMYCLFPCPWPKRTHARHRLFSGNFLELLNNRLKARGRLLIVTDDPSYREWIRERAAGRGFHAQIKAVPPQYSTKFEKKWTAQGRKEFFEITLTKKKHRSIRCAKEAPLKAYALKGFNPEAFHFDDCTAGGAAVVLKDFLFDPKRLKAMVHVVVAEGPLTQHFRAAIKMENDFWRVVREPGQQIFLTPGIAKALERIYQAAVKTAGRMP